MSRSCAEPIAWFAAHGVTVERVMTDNGTGYRSKVHAAAIAQLGIKHLRTRPYRPRTNGKAERFIQTLQLEWAYASVYQTSSATPPRPAALAQLLQLPTTTQRPRPQDANLTTGTGRLNNAPGIYS